jgi:PAS domain S-box-containing protein
VIQKVKRKYTENEQETTLQRYDILTRNSGVGVWELNPQGYTEYLNSAMCEILNINSIEDLNNITFHSFFTQASLKLMMAEHKKRAAKITSSYEVELVRTNGEKRNILINGSPLLSEDGAFVGMIGTFMDITEKKTVELELKKSEERFRLLFEKLATPLGMSRNGIHILANDAYLKLFKYSFEELIGKSILDLIAPSHKKMVVEYIASRQTGQSIPYSYEAIGIRSDNTEFSFNVDVSYIELLDGMATVASIKDISEQKSAESALRASEAKFRGVFESSMVGITFSNSKQQIVEANEKFLSIIQYTKEDIKNSTLQWSHLTPDEYLDLDKKAVVEFMQKGFISPYEKEYIRKDGTRIPVLIAAAILEGHSGLGVGFVIDISELKRSKEETNKLANELSTFLYMASHDLKGPLASVIGLTNIARNDIEEPKALEYLNLIQECTLKLDRSLMNFLEIIKIKNISINHKMVEFKPLVEEILSSLIHQASFSNTEFIIKDSLFSKFYSDKEMIRSIIQNLVENSVKYQTRLRNPVVKIELKEDAENIFIAVDDNGRGIDPAIKDKIFNIFYRGDVSSKGSGLGLYIVKNAAEKLGGSIEITNKPEGGSIFTLMLPKANH